LLRVLLNMNIMKEGGENTPSVSYPKKAKNPVNSRQFNINYSEYDR
jgi:hypothetical protein